MTPRSVLFSTKFTVALRDYKYTSLTPEAMDELTCPMILKSLINPVTNLHHNIKGCERVVNKGVGFTAQYVMGSVFGYATVTVAIQS